MQYIDDAEFQINIDLDQGGRISSLIWREMQFTIPFRGTPNNFGWFPLDNFFSNGSWQEIGPGRSRLHLPKEYKGATLEQSYEVLDDAIRWSLEYDPSESDIPVTLGAHAWFARDLERGGSAELEFKASTPAPWDETFSQVQGVPAIVWEDVARISIESYAPIWTINSVDSEAILVAPQSTEHYLEALFVFTEE
jgi:aldose 1-epimerase